MHLKEILHQNVWQGTTLWEILSTNIFPKVFGAIQKKYAVIWAYNCSKGLAPLPGTPNIISPAFAKDLPVSPARIRSSLRFALRRKTSDRTIKTTKAIMHRSNIPAEYEFLAISEKHFNARVSNWGSTASFSTIGSFQTDIISKFSKYSV